MIGNSLIHQRASLRDRLAKACDEFLAKGGQVEQLDVARRKPDQTGSLKSRASAGANVDKSSRRSLRKRDEEMVRLAWSLVEARQSAEHVRQRLGLGRLSFEQFVARHAIRFDSDAGANQ